ncbi:MAG: MFS transporter [Streptosporangiales bacterium]|nr:MFS transporter [Streptosporangiales bacterium]
MAYHAGSGPSPGDVSRVGDAAARDLTGRLERLPLTRYQKRLFVIIATAWLFDSMDLAALTFVLAPISSEFALTAWQAGMLASGSFVGMAVGASTAGALADRFGRRPVFTTSMLCWGLASFIAAFSWDFTSLLICRFFIGFGMGAEFPVAQSLLAEFVPSKVRGRYLGYLEGFWPLGFITCGAVSLVLVPTLGWRSLYVLLGVLSLYALYLRRSIPESVRWYVVKGRHGDASRTLDEIEEKVATAYGQPLPPVEDVPASAEASGRAPVMELLGRSYRVRTVMIWTLWFCVLLGYYGITTWQAKLLADGGMTVAKSIGFVLGTALCGIPGFLIASWLLERIGRRPTIVGFVLLSAIAAYAYGQMGTTVGLVIVGCFMQFCFFGMWSALYAYTPEIFATRFRATGCGTASTFGRIGAVVGPLIMPTVLAAWGNGAAFAVAAVFMAIGAVTVAVLGPETRNKKLEEVSA